MNKYALKVIKKMKIFMLILCRILIVKGKYLFGKWSLTQKSMLTNGIMNMLKKLDLAFESNRKMRIDLVE